jgi:hypothetical protein
MVITPINRTLKSRLAGYYANNEIYRLGVDEIPLPALQRYTPAHAHVDRAEPQRAIVIHSYFCDDQGVFDQGIRLLKRCPSFLGVSFGQLNSDAASPTQARSWMFPYP